MLMSLSSQLECKFRADILLRGEAYLKAEKVTVTRITADELFGVVKDGTEIQTRLTFRNDTLSMTCSCLKNASDQHESGCKHVWATILFSEAQGHLDRTGKLNRSMPFENAEESLDEEEPVEGDRCRLCLRVN